MDNESRKKLQRVYRTLVALNSQLEQEAMGSNIDNGLVDEIENAVRVLDPVMPGLLSPFDKNRHFSHESAGVRWYRSSPFRAYLASAISTLSTEMEEQGSADPVIESRDFSFVSNRAIQKILERDYQEIQRAFVAGCWKSTIVLSGGAIEALLLDLLQDNESEAVASPKAPDKPLDKWDLSDLINVSVDLEKAPAGVDKLSHSVREYRNLIHPGRELREKLKFGREEARIAIEVLNMVHRDLGGPG